VIICAVLALAIGFPPLVPKRKAALLSCGCSDHQALEFCC